MTDRLQQLLDQIADPDDSDRAAEAFSQLEAEAVPEWLPQLHELLATLDDFFVREAVAPAIIRLEGMASLPKLIAALRLGFQEGHDCDSLQSWVTSLIESDPASSLAHLLPLATSSDARDRADAAWLLGFVHSAVPSQTFVNLASDDSSKVRQAACGSLASLKGNELVFETLMTRLDDPDEDVRISAMSALGYFGDPRALPQLEKSRSRASKRARHILDYAISQLKKHEHTAS
jgi:HEAT repeat protein